MSTKSDERFTDNNIGNETTGSEKLPGLSKGSDNRFEIAPGEAHIDTDSKDQRSLSNRLAAAQKHEAEEDESSKTVTDPLEPAQAHGNKPSRGAEIDAEIQRDEEEYLKKKKD